MEDLRSFRARNASFSPGDDILSFSPTGDDIPSFSPGDDGGDGPAE